MSDRSLTILMLAQLPPPIHGVTTVNRQVYDCLKQNKFHTVNVKPLAHAKDLTDIGKGKARKMVSILWKMMILRVRSFFSGKVGVVYFPFSPTWPVSLRDSIVAFFAKGIGKRVLVHVHGEGLHALLYGSGFKRWFLRFLIRKTEVIAITKEAARAAEGAGLFAHVWRLPNAVSVNVPEVLDTKDLDILFISNLKEEKGVLTYLESLKKMKANGLSVRGHVIGGDSAKISKAKVEQIAAAKGLGKNVTFYGPLYGAEKEAIFQKSDIFLYPSRHDHAPLVLLEAMGHGLVPLICHTGGMRDMVGPDFSTHVFDYTDDEDMATLFAKKVGFYAENKGELLNDQKLARARYEEEFTEQKLKGRLENIFFRGKKFTN